MSEHGKGLRIFCLLMTLLVCASPCDSFRAPIIGGTGQYTYRTGLAGGRTSIPFPKRQAQASFPLIRRVLCTGDSENVIRPSVRGYHRRQVVVAADAGALSFAWPLTYAKRSGCVAYCGNWVGKSPWIPGIWTNLAFVSVPWLFPGDTRASSVIPQAEYVGQHRVSLYCVALEKKKPC